MVCTSITVYGYISSGVCVGGGDSTVVFFDSSLSRGQLGKKGKSLLLPFIKGAPVAQWVKRWPTDLADRVRSSLERKEIAPSSLYKRSPCSSVG